MHVRKLSGCLNKLFGSRDAVDFSHPLFLSITHLDVFVDLADAAMYTRLATIPALTHLCLNGVIAWDIFRGLLADCSTLKLLVNVWNHQLASPAEKFANATPFVDARFVVATFMDYWADWEAGAEGREDFWVAAEEFVARKRRGEIPGTFPWPCSCRSLIFS
jgi:hypothetical protein